MSYASQTPNLGLPQWILSEPPQMTDFNTAFSNIDQFAGEKGQPNGLATLDAEGNLVQAHAAGYKLGISMGGTGANNPIDARSNLGFVSLLWSGSWAVGGNPITVTGLSNYSVVLVYLSGSGYIVPCTVSSQRVRGMTCTDNDASNDNLYIVGFEADRSGDTLSNGRAVGFSHIPGGNHATAGTFGVSAIYGIC